MLALLRVTREIIVDNPHHYQLRTYTCVPTRITDFKDSFRNLYSPSPTQSLLNQ